MRKFYTSLHSMNTLLAFFTWHRSVRQPRPIDLTPCVRALYNLRCPTNPLWFSTGGHKVCLDLIIYRCARSSMDRAPDYGSGGYRFKSCRAHHEINSLCISCR